MPTLGEVGKIIDKCIIHMFLALLPEAGSSTKDTVSSIIVIIANRSKLIANSLSTLMSDVTS